MFLQDDDEPAERPETPAGALWLGLAHLALSGTAARRTTRRIPCSSPAPSTPSRSRWRTTGWCSTTSPDRRRDVRSARRWEPRIRERVSRLVTSLKPETLRRVLEAATNDDERRQFALTAAQVSWPSRPSSRSWRPRRPRAARRSRTSCSACCTSSPNTPSSGPEGMRAEAESTLRRERRAADQGVGAGGPESGPLHRRPRGHGPAVAPDTPAADGSSTASPTRCCSWLWS